MVGWRWVILMALRGVILKSISKKCLLQKICLALGYGDHQVCWPPRILSSLLLQQWTKYYRLSLAIPLCCAIWNHRWASRTGLKVKPSKYEIIVLSTREGLWSLQLISWDRLNLLGSCVLEESIRDYFKKMIPKLEHGEGITRCLFFISKAVACCLNCFINSDQTFGTQPEETSSNVVNWPFQCNSGGNGIRSTFHHCSSTVIASFKCYWPWPRTPLKLP